MKQSFGAHVMELAVPIVEPGKIRHQPLALAQLCVVGHQLATNGEKRIERAKLGDLFLWIVAAIEKNEIDSKILFLFCQPFRDYVLRKAKERREAMHGVGRGCPDGWQNR